MIDSYYFRLHEEPTFQPLDSVLLLLVSQRIASRTNMNAFLPCCRNLQYKANFTIIAMYALVIICFYWSQAVL